MARDVTDDQLAVRVGDWITRTALAGTTGADILGGICDRLDAAGFSLVRATIAADLLDPTYDGIGVRWNRGTGVTAESFARTGSDAISAEWLQSPFYALIESGATRLRRRLDAGYRRGEFPLVDRFQDEGATDYVAFVERIDESLRFGEFQGMVSSWTTDACDGFSDGQLDVLQAIMPPLTVALTLRTTHRIARTTITTYLGQDAALRVLGGNIVRGQAEKIRAVVWFSDLAGFTRISDRIGPEGMLALLNDYAEIQVEAIEGRGGHVLKFIGDGLLAIFPDGEGAGAACARALDAAVEQRRGIAALNERRAAAELPVTDAHIALHVGELLYGNVGSPRRLDFTVLGPAVNETARIEALCASLEQPIIVSSAFAEAADESRSRLVSLGRYAMKGVSRPQELFTLDAG